MTLLIGSFVPTAIVFSADSRASLTVPAAPGANLQTQVVLSDSAEKVFVLYDKFAVAAAGAGAINNLPIAHYMEAFQSSRPCPATAQEAATQLLAYFRTLNPIPACSFFLGGYDGTVPWVLVIDVAANTLVRGNVDANGNVAYGLQVAGDTAVATRLLSQPQFNPPFNLLNKQDAIDFSRHLIRTTIDQMRFEPRFPTVGGHIDTVVVTPGTIKFLVKKELHG